MSMHLGWIFQMLRYPMWPGTQRMTHSGFIWNKLAANVLKSLKVACVLVNMPQVIVMCQQRWSLGHWSDNRASLCKPAHSLVLLVVLLPLRNGHLNSHPPANWNMVVVNNQWNKISGTVLIVMLLHCGLSCIHCSLSCLMQCLSGHKALVVSKENMCCWLLHFLVWDEVLCGLKCAVNLWFPALCLVLTVRQNTASGETRGQTHVGHSLVLGETIIIVKIFAYFASWNFVSAWARLSVRRCELLQLCTGCARSASMGVSCAHTGTDSPEIYRAYM